MPVNLSPVPTGRALTILREGWAAQARGDFTTAYMLHGKPGVGKTQIVETLAAETGAELIDLRLTTIEPQDLRGLPYYDHAAAKTVWYRPEDLPDDPDQPTILFLDELTSAAPLIQPTVYGLLQERRVGRHRLPPTTFLVAAGNTTADGAVAYEMGTGLSDRLVHLLVAAEAQDWLENFALPNGMHPAVTAFVQTRPDLLDTTDEALSRGDMIAATPRSWERVSHILSSVEDQTIRRRLVAGTVGEAVAAEFSVIAEDIAATVRATEMIGMSRAARLEYYPETLHGLYALVHGLNGLLTADTTKPVIETLADLRKLDTLRPQAGFGRLPLGELTTQGFEMLISKGLALELGPAFLDHPDYKAYAAERQALGLA
ncbi:MAG: AAA family ATPase [Pseudomonadota bacterium]